MLHEDFEGSVTSLLARVLAGLLHWRSWVQTSCLHPFIYLWGEVLLGIGVCHPTFLRWLERVLVFFDALYLGVKIFRLELANHDHILPQNNNNIKVSIFCRFLKKFVAMATQLGFEI